MSDINATIICATADKAAAEALAEQFPGGAGTFSVPVATTPGVTDLAQATHWYGSGFFNPDMVDAFDKSVSPMYKVFPMTDELPNAEAHLAACTPQLYRVYPVEVV